MILIAQTTAIIKEPRAREPAWYLKIHQIPELYDVISEEILRDLSISLSVRSM